jgi:hypothetical protein
MTISGNKKCFRIDCIQDTDLIPVNFDRRIVYFCKSCLHGLLSEHIIEWSSVGYRVIQS